MARLPDDNAQLRLGDLEGDGVLPLVREQALRSLYFFAKAILGYHDLVPRVHRPFCDWMQGLVDSSGEPIELHEDSLRGKRKLGLMPRGHFKTTINMADAIHKYLHNHEIRLLMVNESAVNAEYMLREMKGHFENNEIFRHVFPEAIPADFNKTNWTTTSVTLPRKGVYREPTFDTAGTTSKIVSRHYTHIKGDDLVSDEAMESPALMKKAKKFVNRLVSLLVNPRLDFIEIIGTRWAYDDVYGHIIEKFPEFDLFLRKAIIMGEDGPEPFFPQRYTMEIFQGIIERDPDQWATQYANDPTDSTLQDFRPEWLKWCDVGVDRAIRYKKGHMLHRWDLHDLRYYIHVDPSMGENPNSDYAGITVPGLAPTKDIFLVDAIAQRLDPIKLVDKIIELAHVYIPKAVTVESNAYQKAIVYYLEQAAKREGIFLNIIPVLSPSGVRKEARIRGALQPFFAEGRVFVRRGLIDFIEEYTRFGKSQDDHMMDSLAQGPEVWRFPFGREAQRRAKARAKRDEAPRGSTGYGY